MPEQWVGSQRGRIGQCHQAEAAGIAISHDRAVAEHEIHMVMRPGCRHIVRIGRHAA